MARRLLETLPPKKQKSRFIRRLSHKQANGFGEERDPSVYELYSHDWILHRNRRRLWTVSYTHLVLIAAGLPLTWVSEQREEFKQYLIKNETVDFNFKGKDYHIRIVGADVYPQGFAAIVNNLSDFSGVNMLCDIGNGTMNIMFVNDKKPDSRRCFTEKFGTHQCMLQIRENLMRIHHAEPPEEMITRILRFGTADIDGEYLKTITNTAKEYVEGIFRRLREHGYDSKLMKLYIVGGGGCMIRNFAEYDESRITVNDDICATAKGYERMLEMKLIKNGGAL